VLYRDRQGALQLDALVNHTPIGATLSGDDIVTALGITAQSSSPVLALCRQLVAAGHDPATAMHVVRGDTLALIIRSIGEVIRLRIGSHGVGFEADPECGARPPTRLSGRAGVRHRARSEATP
jgi:hypothetical protein